MARRLMDRPVRDPWRHLGAMTPARIALGRAGVSLPTAEVLAFAMAHAEARDAVHAKLDAGEIAARIEAAGFRATIVRSAADTRAGYLRRPDLGRKLDAESAGRLSLIREQEADPIDLALIVADGLSATAADRHALPLLDALRPWIIRAGWRVGPVIVATQARVALGDEIGAALRARMSVVMIGERPGLSAPDSLGIYLTYAPRPGRNDGERNCISNGREEGLSFEDAAFRLAWLIDQALKRALTGVMLKDESDAALVDGRPPAMLP